MLPVRRIGVFGGSFDPPHFGHLICARAAAERLSLEKVLVIPAAQQPLKPAGATASMEDRMLMVEATFGSDPIFEISSLEIERGGKSFTVDTLRDLERLYPKSGYQLFLIVGADALADFRLWKEPAEIFRIASVAAMMRSGIHLPAFPPEWNLSLIELDTPLIDVSSSGIREKILRGESISELVPVEVEHIIRTKSLYIVPNGS